MSGSLVTVKLEPFCPLKVSLLVILLLEEVWLTTEPPDCELLLVIESFLGCLCFVCSFLLLASAGLPSFLLGMSRFGDSRLIIPLNGALRVAFLTLDFVTSLGDCSATGSTGVFNDLLDILLANIAFTEDFLFCLTLPLLSVLFNGKGGFVVTTSLFVLATGFTWPLSISSIGFLWTCFVCT